MPLYEYQCTKCKEQFSRLVPISKSDELPTCPKCGSKQTKKLMSSFSSSGCCCSSGKCSFT